MTRFADRYTLGEVLGSGSFATVYRAHDNVEDRPVAIKVLQPELVTPEIFDRFRNEALALSRLSSPHVARVFDFGREELGAYLVMEFIAGVPLDVPGLGRALHEAEVLVAARALLAGLSAAHAHGLVHRDVKPANVLAPGGLGGLGALKVLDFGIAREARRSEILEALGTSETREGDVVGTPAYMAPEQVTLGEVGPAADVWSSGLVLFELLDRGPLFSGASQHEQLVARVANDAALEGRVTEPLRGLLERMLARNPARRFVDASEALRAVTAASADSRQERAKADTAAFAPTAIRAPSAPPSRRQLPAKPPEPLRSLVRLDPDPVVALRSALSALDLPMIDALARRERDSDVGRCCRALGLALRLELEAAALVIEPALATSVLARSLGATLVSARASSSIARRVDLDPTDAWVDELEPRLACLLASLVAPLAGPDRSVRNAAMCARAARRAEGTPEGELARLTAKIAAAMADQAQVDGALSEARRAYPPGAPRRSPAEELVRCLGIGNVAFRADELVAREHLERAVLIATECALALFEARALVSWGAVLLSARPDVALHAFERASTLLAHGDASGLEQMASHNTGASMMIARRFAESIPHLQRAAALARKESLVEYEALAGASLALACMTLADPPELVSTLADLSRIERGAVSLRARSFLHFVDAMVALRRAALVEARREVRVACEWAEKAGLGGTDAWLMGEVLALVMASAAHESVDLLGRAAELGHSARERGYASFVWFDSLLSAFGHVPDAALRDALQEPMRRVAVLLGPQS